MDEARNSQHTKNIIELLREKIFTMPTEGERKR